MSWLMWVLIGLSAWLVASVVLAVAVARLIALGQRTSVPIAVVLAPPDVDLALVA